MTYQRGIGHPLHSSRETGSEDDEAPTRAVEFKMINICIHIAKANYSASMKKRYVPNIPKDTIDVQQDSIFCTEKKAKRTEAKETQRKHRETDFFFFFFLILVTTISKAKAVF
jgi:hypothetical protein